MDRRSGITSRRTSISARAGAVRPGTAIGWCGGARSTWPRNRARKTRWSASQLGEIQALRSDLTEARTELTKLRKYSRRELWAKLEHLAAVAAEAVGSTSAPVVDTQGVIRLRALLEGHVVINRVQQLQERLDIARSVNRRSEDARMALHRRVGELEEALAHIKASVVGYCPDADQTAEYIRLFCTVVAAGDAASEAERDKVEALGIQLGLLQAPVEIELD